MGPVSQYIFRFIQTHLEKHGIVVWYDPQGRYAHLLEADWGTVRVLRCEPDGLLRLRHEAEEALEAGSTSERLGEQFSPLLAYLPFTHEATEHALIELETAGVALYPNAPADRRTDLACDTHLTALARQALQGHLPPAELEKVMADVEAGKLDLAELDALVRPVDIRPALRTFYGAQTPEDLLLAFFTAEGRDEALKAKGIFADLVAFFQASLGLSQPPQEVTRLRSFVIAHGLTTEAAVNSGTAEAKAWQSLPVLGSHTARALAVRTVQRWRRDRNLEKAYRHWAAAVEEQLKLHAVWESLPTEALTQVETFPGVDNLLLERLAEELAQQGHQAEVRARAHELATRRARGFWAEGDGPLRGAWETLLAAIEVLEQVDVVHAALRKGRVWQVDELVERYAALDDGWHRLDGAYRRFETRRDALLDGPPRPAFTRLTSAVRHAYRETIHRLTERFVKAWEQGRLGEGLLLQREVFRSQVWPAVQDHRRVAYVLVDALRYELVADLLVQLQGDKHNKTWLQEMALQPALGVLPSITVLGMAALLPGAEVSLGLVEHNGALMAEVDGQLLHTRQDRLRFFAERVAAAGRRFEALTLDELVEATPRDLERLKEKDVVVVTSGEIDQVAENMKPRDAQEHFHRVLRALVRGIRRLTEAAFAQVVMTADHGFLLFGDALDEGEKIDSPAGTTVKIGRRYWIGEGGRTSRAYAYFAASALELTGGLEFAFPRGAGVFRSSGGHAHYYHGGISLQELVVPVLRLQPRSTEQVVAVGGVACS